MFDSKKEPNGCGSGATLVAYLYGELGEDERSGFELHLEGCEGCAGELASFSELRISIAGVKALELSPADPKSEEPTPTSSWMDSLRDLFATSLGVRAFAGAVAAVFLVAAGLYLFGILSYGPTSVEVTADPTPDAVTPTPIDTGLSPELAAQPVEGPGATADEPESAATNVPARVATDGRDRPATKRKRPSRPSVQIAEASEPPRLSEAASEDVEDDSLRLTDLFSDLSED